MERIIGKIILPAGINTAESLVKVMCAKKNVVIILQSGEIFEGKITEMRLSAFKLKSKDKMLQSRSHIKYQNIETIAMEE